MKLLRCHIENFGKLSDVTMDFSGPLSIIKEENAWGKSTLAVFLKAMFYGFDTKKEAGAVDKERNLYRPWQGGHYGGEVDFTVGSKSYHMVRSFGRTEKTDSFQLYDLSTNLESLDYTQNLGEEIFDLDRSSFARSIYIAQSDCESTSTDAINAKLGNLAENTNDINNFEKACRLLQERMNKLSPERVTGSIKARKNQLTELQQELKSYEAAEGAYAKIKLHMEQTLQKKERLEEERNGYTKALEQASTMGRRQEQRKAYEKLCADEQEKQYAYLVMRKRFPRELPSPEELEAKQKEVRQCEEFQTTLGNIGFSDNERREYQKFAESLETDLDKDLNEHLKEIDGKLDRLSSIGQLKEEIGDFKNKEPIIQLRLAQQDTGSLLGKSSSSLGILVSIIILVIGIGAGALGIYQIAKEGAGPLLLICAVVAVIVGIIVLTASILERNKKHKLWLQEEKRQKEEWDALMGQQQKNEKEINKRREKINEILNDIKEYLSYYGIYCDASRYAESLYELKMMRKSYEQMKKRWEAYQITSDRLQNSKSSLADYLSGLGFELGSDMNAQFQGLLNETNECLRLEQEWKHQKSQREIFESSHAMEELQRTEAMALSLDECNDGIRRCDEALEEVRDSMDADRRQMEGLQEQMDLRDEKEQLIEEYGQIQQEEIEKYQIYQQTLDYLSRAREQFTARYMAPISRGFSKYYNWLRGENEDQWMLDANISVRMKQEGQLREPRLLSAGYRDLIGVCMRLALADAMYPEEKPFLILDDPFVNLDEEKVARGNALLEKLAEDYQVIYFTCHISRTPLLDRNGIM